MPAALPVAAAAPLAPLLDGPPVPARVAVTGRWAAYLVAPPAAPGGPDRVLVIATPDAVVPPCAVVLRAGLTPADLVAVGDDVTVGGGGLRTPAGVLAVRRWWTPPRLPTGTPDAGAVRSAVALLGEPPVPGGPDDARARALLAAAPAAEAVLAGDVTGAVTALTRVIGLGPGSTPSGDDVAAAVLLAGRAVGAPRVDRTAGAVLRAAAGRTTPVSIGLLAEAAAGRAVPPVVGALRALLGAAPVEPAVRRLLAVGSTSGTDLATGLVATVAAAVRRTRPRPSQDLSASLRRSA